MEFFQLEQQIIKIEGHPLDNNSVVCSQNKLIQLNYETKETIELKLYDQELEAEDQYLQIKIMNSLCDNNMSKLLVLTNDRLMVIKVEAQKLKVLSFFEYDDPKRNQ